ncbi:S1/P1 nuclease [Coralloluteibacterium stylophorae]|uniref:S1/P1 nuclease n=1 Tax=Coralloluteibacterium stylophorae TaxID=1776034 RepID=A0AAP2CDD3_9GAMM|nr:S1/P1 nuclease [Coralloluteibacterium stylophorae]
MATVLVALPRPAAAWNELGHRLVGELAQRQLSPAAQAEVGRLLEGEPEPTLAGVAAWADELRGSDEAAYRRTGGWHYVNFPRGDCHYVAARDCPDGDCVVGAIQAQLRLLADRSRPQPVRRDALKFVVHFVGDVHQPLHAGDRADRGGNDYQISLATDLAPAAYARMAYNPVTQVQGTNLHAVWDGYVLRSRRLDVDAYADALADAVPPADAAIPGPERWAEQSCALLDSAAIYPAGHRLDHDYLERMRPLAEAQIEAAAARLAAALEQALVATPESAAAH